MLHKIFETQYSSWKHLESEIEKISQNKEKGDVFEQFSYFFLKYHSDVYQIKELYCPAATGVPFPSKVTQRLKLEKTDYGVDGVYITADDKLVAYQVKFRSNRSTATAAELSTFWAEAEYADFRCVFANTHKLPKVSSKKKNQISILVDVLDRLGVDYFSALQYFYKTSKINKAQKYSPRPYQSEIIQEVVQGLDEYDRGKLIAACGIGKTLISLWVKERIKSRKTLFLAPSLTLIRQTLENWTVHSNQQFRYVCVCSDKSVAQNLSNDIWDIDTADLDIPVTTSIAELSNFLEKDIEDIVVFSTYQSLDVIYQSCKTTGYEFDLTIFDEAHRTAGVRESEMFTLALNESNIKSKKRLFMTATERLVKAAVKTRIETENRIVFSMDDEKMYGKTLYKLDFGEAIEKGIISDYRIVLAGITNQELNDIIKSNSYLEVNDGQVLSAEDLFKRELLLKAIAELSLEKIITYHSSVKEAKTFAAYIENRVKENSLSYVGHINGSMSSNERAKIFTEFEESDLGILTNVRCLAEGVDIPAIDAVFFSDPKSSLIDIVQAIGRAVRQDFGAVGKVAYVIIPVLFDKDQEVLSGDYFDEFFDVIQSLRDQDKQLAEWIDNINLSAVRGKFARSKNGRSPTPGKISLLLPSDIDYNDFSEKLSLKIAEVNKNPTGTTGVGSKLGKKQRYSTIKRVFKTIGDYTPEKLKESLIDVTLERFSNFDDVKSRKDISVNNNNVSHSIRLGIISHNESNNFELTDIGVMYKSNNITFDDLLRNQMMKYFILSEDFVLFPYRIVMGALLKVISISYHEFLFSIYTISPSGDKESNVVDAVCEKIAILRENYPNINLVSESNKDSILDELNSFYGTVFSYNDIWTDRTTTFNQYRYFRRHLELFSNIIKRDAKSLELIEDSEDNVLALLANSQTKDFLTDYGSYFWIR